MSAYSPTVTADAAAYGAAVRSHLDDLAPDVVEELAGGLEADLAELAAESTQTLGQRLGDPAAYAAELRASAGLPPRPPRRSPRADPFAAELALARAQLRQTNEALARTSWWGPVSSAVVSLRPAWWLARAWVAYQLLHSMLAGVQGSVLPRGLLGLLVLLGLSAASVALGRGWLSGWPVVRSIVIAGNVIAALLLLLAASHASSGGAVYAEEFYAPAPQGLWLDGEPVTNVFPYGPDGQPLTGITLLDERGEPIEVSPDSGSFGFGAPGERTPYGVRTEDGALRWNVFPLPSVVYPEGEVRYDDEGEPLPPTGVDPEPAAPPRLMVPGVQSTASPTGSPTPPDPSASPTSQSSTTGGTPTGAATSMTTGAATPIPTPTPTPTP